MPRKSPNQTQSPVLNTLKVSFCLLLVLAIFVGSIPEMNKRDEALSVRDDRLASLETIEMANLDTQKRINALHLPEYLEWSLMLDGSLKRRQRELYIYQHEEAP